jgi:hypothetical protein
MSLTKAFLSNPIEFLKAHALSPPNGEPGKVIKAWKVANAGNITSGANGDGSSTVSLKKAGATRVFSEFVQHGGFPGALSVSLSPSRTSPDSFEQFWLPWESLSITKNHLPAVPAKGGDDFPSVFMTAGINGCSVFVDGPATQPTVYHAGINGNLVGPAEQFWKHQLQTAFEGTAGEGHEPAGQAHSQQYMQNSPNVQRYLAWLNANTATTLQIELLSNFGSVIGIRNKTDWSFYLQKNVMIQDVQIVKRSQVKSVVAATGTKQYFMKVNGTAPGPRVDRQVTTQPRKFLPDKVTKTYTQRVNMRCACVKVVQIFPQRELVGDWRALDVRTIN